jgi:F0F1-type ATP synthase membrane subunit c/vacuolar-type H+-ATPase subunit K
VPASPSASECSADRWARAAAAAALEGISRNPGASSRIQTPMILGLALIESLVLLAFVVAYFLQAFATKP